MCNYVITSKRSELRKQISELTAAANSLVSSVLPITLLLRHDKQGICGKFRSLALIDTSI